MTPDQPSSPRTDAPGPASFLAAAAALDAIDDAVREAQNRAPNTPGAPGPGPEQALASLLLLRQVREQLAGWETGLIETARDAGASWAELAHPSGSRAVRPPSAATCAAAPARPGPPANSA